MHFMSVRVRHRVWEIMLTMIVLSVAWLVQLNVLSKLSFSSVLCNLPLTMTIIWGTVFGSPLPPLPARELAASSISQVFAYQSLKGSISGALIGAAFAALFSTVTPAYMIAYPIIGWIAGYFTLKSFNQATLFCIPLVFAFTVFGETITAIQLLVGGRPDVFERLVQVAPPEAVLNSLVAPFIYFPMRGWYEFARVRDLNQE